jgi:diguanylate cyclase
VEPSFAVLADRLAEGALDEQDQVAARLAALRRLGETLVVAAPVVFTVGLSLLIGCWLLLLGYQRRIRQQALSDALTGLPNRTLLLDRTAQAIRQADRELVPAALLLLDLDRFKEVNDTLGHHCGDQLLVQVGQRLRAALRSVDTVARLGGDEFAVLLPRISTGEGVVTVANKLHAALEEPFTLEGLALEVEASIGLALYPEHGNDPDELLQRADIAMYVAKQTHAGFVLFDPKQDQHSPRRLALLGELRRAIEGRQLLLHYQPKIDAHSGQVLGVEALVRWQHPTHGLVPPGEFIPLAERTGLIGPLTHYVMDAALHQCRDWRQAGHELAVAVNVSARRLLDLAFPDEVGGLLARWEVPARLLVVEITESAIMADPAHAMQILGRLNQMGVGLSIDDFGTGYSSMAYLKSLPVHELKVDRSFVSQMTSNSSDAVIVRSTVDLGRNLGLRVVAEGVEDQTTLEALDALGCDAVQGYHVSRPITPDDLIDWLQLRARLGSLVQQHPHAVLGPERDGRP